MRRLDFREPAQLEKLFGQLRKAFFIGTGAMIMSSGVVFFLQHQCLDCTMVYWILGTGILAAWVYPTSVLIIGFFFIAYGLKFGFRGIGLMVMVFGAFDVFDKMFALYIQGLTMGKFGDIPGTIANSSDVYFWIQNALMLGGFILAGFPKIKADRFLLGTVLVLLWSELTWWPYLVQWHGLFAYQVYEVALFIYVYHSTDLRQLPHWLSFR